MDGAVLHQHDESRPGARLTPTWREWLSDAMACGAFERMADSQKMEASLGTLPDTVDVLAARGVARRARRREALVMWLAFRLRPRRFSF